MERMAIAKLKALEERARLTKPAAQGDVVTDIINDINNTAEINYSVVAMGAEFRTQSEVIHKMATNDPNTVRPKAPTTKRKREDRVFPFPKRRLAAMRREKEAATSKAREQPTGLDTDNPESDESWPTDKDDAIATLRCRKQKVLTKSSKKQRPKAKAVQKITKKRQAIRTKPHKRKIDSMISALQAPLPRA